MQVEHVISPQTRRVLLSDLSQSDASMDIPFPEDLEEVVLTEAIRSTSRIFDASAAFQIGKTSLETKCHHTSEGPPLRSYIFDFKGAVTPFAAYAQHTCRALCDIRETFPSLFLDDRIAILVPDARFEDGLRQPLLEEMGAHSFPCELVSSSEASSLVSALCRADARAAARAPRLVLSTVDNFDGLERLMVIAVGLDSPKVAETFETRSRLYRALTRAQFFGAVVNAYDPNGLLAYLSRVTLSQKGETAHVVHRDAANQLLQEARKVEEAKRREEIAVPRALRLCVLETSWPLHGMRRRRKRRRRQRWR